jgi:homoserine kinase
VTEPVDDHVLLGVATMLEGHADNAAPALFGGLNSVLQVEQGEPVAMRWMWPEDVQLVVATPAVGLATAKARAALADHVSRADAIFNLQRVLSLVHALQHGEYDRIREAVRDRWHQPARASLVPLLGEVLAIDDPDVLGAFALLVRRDAGRVEQLLTSLYARAGVDATIRRLNVHQTTPTPALSIGH